MADTKISALTAASSALAADELPVNESGTSKKLSLTQVGAVMPLLGVYAPGTFTIPTGGFGTMVKTLVLTGSQRLTMQGTARLRIL
jgi:hypothetical protein